MPAAADVPATIRGRRPRYMTRVQGLPTGEAARAVSSGSHVYRSETESAGREGEKREGAEGVPPGQCREAPAISRRLRAALRLGAWKCAPVLVKE